MRRVRGMTGIRINLSHVSLLECRQSISRIHLAADASGVKPEILIDIQGPELRIGRFPGEIELAEGSDFFLGESGIPLDLNIMEHIEPGDEILLDDGRILAGVEQKDFEFTSSGGVAALVGREQSAEAGYASVHSTSPFRGLQKSRPPYKYERRRKTAVPLSFLTQSPLTRDGSGEFHPALPDALPGAPRASAYSLPAGALCARGYPVLFPFFALSLLTVY